MQTNQTTVLAVRIEPQTQHSRKSNGSFPAQPRNIVKLPRSEQSQGRCLSRVTIVLGCCETNIKIKEKEIMVLLCRSKNYVGGGVAPAHFVATRTPPLFASWITLSK